MMSGGKRVVTKNEVLVALTFAKNHAYASNFGNCNNIICLSAWTQRCKMYWEEVYHQLLQPSHLEVKVKLGYTIVLSKA